MGAVVADFETVEGRSEGGRKFFQGSDTGSVDVRGGDVGTNPQDRARPE